MSDVPFSLRLPEESKLYLTQQARKKKRSLNAEITDRLEQSIQFENLTRHRRSQTPDGDLREVLNKLDELQSMLTSEQFAQLLTDAVINTMFRKKD